MELVCVILGATRTYMEDPSWMVKSYGNFNEMNDLVQHIYDNYKVNRIIYEGQALRQFSVAGGESQVVGQPTVDIDSVIRKDVQINNLNFRYSVQGGGLNAPVAQNQKIATVEVWYRSSCLMEAELFAMSDVKPVMESGLTIRGNEAPGGEDRSGFVGVLTGICLVILVPAVVYLVYNNYRRMMARKQRRRRSANRRRSR
jgi:D-alanyl-D-alanine carboxypeptidase